jgi:hypothetical protein
MRCREGAIRSRPRTPARLPQQPRYRFPRDADPRHELSEPAQACTVYPVSEDRRAGGAHDAGPATVTVLSYLAVPLFLLAACPARPTGHDSRSDAESAAPTSTSDGARDATGLSPALSPPETEDAEGEAVSDPLYEQFRQQIERESKVKPEPASEAEAKAYHRVRMEYSLRRTRAIVAGLSPEKRRFLLAPTEPRRTVQGDWHPAWNRWVEGTILVNDMALFSPGPYRITGTMRGEVMLADFSWAALEGLYWVDCYAQNRAREFARHISVGASVAEDAKKVQAQLLAVVERFGPYAPETAAYDDACSLCALGDEDFAKLGRTLRGLATDAPGLADSLCLSWPDLARELGGSAECRATAEKYLLSMAGPKTVDAPAEEPRLLPGEPPPRDPAYARFAGPLHDLCTQDPLNDFVPNDAVVQCLRRGLAQETRSFRVTQPGIVARFLPAWEHFKNDFCSLEEMVLRDFWLRLRIQGRSYPHCDWLSNLRAAYLVYAWGHDEWQGFADHVRHRRQWSTAHVQPQLGLLRLRAAMSPCAPNVDDEAKCRKSELSAARWKQAQGWLDRLESSAAALASMTCEGWPHLAAALGSDCSQQLKDYYLSFGQSIGKLSLARE